MIVFFFFVTVPGAELIMVPYSKLFPNCFPTQFINDSQIVAKLHRTIRSRDMCHAALTIEMQQHIESIVYKLKDSSDPAA